MAKRQGKSTHFRQKPEPRLVRVLKQRSFEEADREDREFWLSKSPAYRMRALEDLRQRNYGYGEGQPLPRFQRVLKIVEFRAS